MEKIIYMPLLNEGIEVFRPIVAPYMGNNTYKVNKTKEGFSPEELNEEWLFPMGSFVTGRTEKRGEDEMVIAENLIK